MPRMMFADGQKIPASRDAHEPAEFVRWTFVRRGRMLTCEILVNGPSSYGVCVIPHWNAGLSVIEEFERSSLAISRHADLVSQFREDGWVRISHRDTDNLYAA